MRILGNRIVISWVVIFCLTYFWEFHVKPVSGPLYTAAVGEYKNKHYERSADLLRRAYRIDPNNAGVLTLLGWDYLKMGDTKTAESYFGRSHKLAPHVEDTLLGLAYTEIALKKLDEAAGLLTTLRDRGVDTTEVHVAWGTLYRELGRNQEGAAEFQIALRLDKNNPVALKNLREIYNVTGDVRRIRTEFPPLIRPSELAYPARVEGERFAWRVAGAWTPAYLAGVDLTPSLPGHFPIDSPQDPSLYSDWLLQISEMGANSLRVYTILPPAFYRALVRFNSTTPRAPLWLLQGISFGDPPRGDLFNRDYSQACQKEIRDTIDAIHGRGDMGPTNIHTGGIFSDNAALWVAGFILGQTWLPHVVTENNQLHIDMTQYQGTYVEVSSGSATEIFLARMIDYAAWYEESKYNWQHPAGFLSWSTLDPLRHPTESTLLEEVSIRRARSERVPMPPGPYDDDDAVSLDPMHLRARERFAAGYFAAYSVFPFYPDFINRDPSYQQVHDAAGINPFFGYLQDLKAHHRGIPLLISEYGLPTSLGIGHFSPAGFNEGGLTGEQQGELLARFTRNIFDAGAAGGMVFEWLDQWYRESWLFRNFETLRERKPLWTNFMNPAQYYGLLAMDPRRHRDHLLTGNPSEWAGKPPLYADVANRKFQAVGNRFDPARKLRALYADADEGFLYLRLVIDNMDNDKDGQPDWAEANYLIGLATAPGQAGLIRLPFIAPLRFPMGMTYAIQLSGSESSRIWIASSYDPYQIVPVDGILAQTVLVSKLGWKPKVTDRGSFEPEVIEPNRRRFTRDGKYFPPERYDRGILRYGSLDPKAPDYDPLAEWHANVQTNTVDLRIPWNLLNVTDPSSLKIFMGLEQDGTVLTAETAGVMPVVFSYRPLEAARLRPIMEEAHPIADSLPVLDGSATLLPAALKRYRWPKWETPQFTVRPKASYGILKTAFFALRKSPLASQRAVPRLAGGWKGSSMPALAP